MSQVGLVLYTDGGCYQTNPGYVGWGVHGYLYYPEHMKKGIGLKDNQFSQYGYVPKSIDLTKLDTAEVDTERFKTWLDTKEHYSVTPISIVHAYGTYYQKSTNNFAELNGLIEALKILIEKKPTITYILSDSEYVVKGFNIRIEQFHNSDYKKNNEDMPNANEWKKLYELKQQLASLNLIYKLNWVKGHNGCVGNEYADELATIAAQVSFIKKKSDFHYVECEVSSFFKEDESSHPLLSTSKFYFNPLQDKEHPTDRGVYYLGEPGGDNNKKEVNRDIFQGKQFSDASLAVVKLKNKDPVLETIKERQYEALAKAPFGRDILVIGQLNTINNKKVYNDISLYGKDYLRVSQGRKADLSTIDKRLITFVAYPMFLSMRTLEALTVMEQLLDCYCQGKLNFPILDITDWLYQSKEKKGVITKSFKNEFTNQVKKVEKTIELLKDEYPQLKEDIKKKLILTFGLDLPSRNTLKKIESLNPKIKLIIQPMGGKHYEFNSIVELDNQEVGIWRSSFANQFILF